MSKYGNVEFEKKVNEAYKLLWDMYRPKDHIRLKDQTFINNCNWDS